MPIAGAAAADSAMHASAHWFVSRRRIWPLSLTIIMSRSEAPRGKHACANTPRYVCTRSICLHANTPRYAPCARCISQPSASLLGQKAPRNALFQAPVQRLERSRKQFRNCLRETNQCTTNQCDTNQCDTHQCVAPGPHRVLARSPRRGLGGAVPLGRPRRRR
jgi:hypothetical protein